MPQMKPLPWMMIATLTMTATLTTLILISFTRPMPPTLPTMKKSNKAKLILII